jgi:hypothetical protein
LRVRRFLLCRFPGSPSMLGGQSAAGEQSATPRGPFRQRWSFSVGGDFCNADCARLVFQTVHPFSGGQSMIARRTVRSLCSFLIRLFGSFASFLVLPRVLQGVIRRTCS